MKKSILIASTLMLTSCYTYQPLVNVISYTGVPQGTTAIMLQYNLDDIKRAFISNGFLIQSMEGGFITDEKLLDEGTRAKYKVVQFDQASSITCYWATTEKVASQIRMWQTAIAGYSTYQRDPMDWNQVIYDVGATRPKRVFDYAIQIVESNNFTYNFR